MYFIRIRVADALKSVPTGAVPTGAVKAIDGSRGCWMYSVLSLRRLVVDVVFYSKVYGKVNDQSYPTGKKAAQNPRDFGWLGKGLVLVVQNQAYNYRSKQKQSSEYAEKGCLKVHHNYKFLLHKKNHYL